MIENIVNILLVEDEEAHAELFRRAFAVRAPNVTVTVAGSIQEAQTCITQRRPDLMVTDIFLPDGKGTDLLPADKRLPSFPVVVLTSHGNEQTAVDAMRAGAVNYVTKSDTSLANMPAVAEEAIHDWQQLVRENEREEAQRRANEELDRLVCQRTAELEEANAGLKEKIAQHEQSERRFRQLLESAPDAMVIADRSGRIVLVNAQAETLFGYKRDEMLGQTTEMLLPESNHEAHVRSRNAYFEEPRVRRMEAGLELQAMHKSGRLFPVEIALSPLETVDGILISSAIRDLTQRKRVERELRDNQAQMLAAQKIQECLLPNAPPKLPGFDIAGAFHPAEFTAGDYFDYLTMSDESLGLVIADVSGHGFAPALLMASTHALLQSLAHTHCDVSTILMRANRFLSAETELDRFVTLLLGRLDTVNRTFVYASAGHSPGFLLDRSGDVKRRLESTSLPLAVMPDIEFPASAPIDLESGDMLLLLTDGFHEAESAEGEYFGFRRLLEVVRSHRNEPAAAITGKLYEAACDFTSPKMPADDLTALVVKVA